MKLKRRIEIAMKVAHDTYQGTWSALVSGEIPGSLTDPVVIGMVRARMRNLNARYNKLAQWHEQLSK